MGFSGFFFGHQWDPLGPITDAMTEIGILSGLFGSLTPLLTNIIRKEQYFWYFHYKYEVKNVIRCF